MFGIVMAAALLGSSPLSLSAESVAIETNQQTEASSNARFQIVQSSLMIRDTFRLDRYTGRVWRLVRDSDWGDMAWDEMPVMGKPTLAQASSPRFQIFLSGTLRRNTFLIDGESGQTWRVQSSKIDESKPAGDGNTVTVWMPLKAVDLRGDPE